MIMERSVDPDDNVCTVCCCVCWCLPCTLSEKQWKSWRFWWWKHCFKGCTKYQADYDEADRLVTSDRSLRNKERDQAMRRAQSQVERRESAPCKKKRSKKIKLPRNPFQRKK
eukprot:TRINITY_DN4748_c0_g1_i1.p1 TRINITY_DN4748_c0_g1~~TRINITY_DN4748_c0_g1_i1.p1  ORF type:complete len:112 (+),score=7.78 TRINITY_DN4748_c0_g1_i1:79-414(+)